MTLEEITLAFSGSQSEFTPIFGKRSDNSTVAISKILTPLLLEIPHNKYKDGERPYTLWVIISTKDDYTTVHG